MLFNVSKNSLKTYTYKNEIPINHLHANFKKIQGTLVDIKFATRINELAIIYLPMIEEKFKDTLHENKIITNTLIKSKTTNFPHFCHDYILSFFSNLEEDYFKTREDIAYILHTNEIPIDALDYLTTLLKQIFLPYLISHGHTKKDIAHLLLTFENMLYADKIYLHLKYSELENHSLTKKTYQSIQEFSSACASAEQVNTFVANLNNHLYSTVTDMLSKSHLTLADRITLISCCVLLIYSSITYAKPSSYSLYFPPINEKDAFLIDQCKTYTLLRDHTYASDLTIQFRLFVESAKKFEFNQCQQTFNNSNENNPEYYREFTQQKDRLLELLHLYKTSIN